MGLHDSAYKSSGAITGDVAVSAVPSVIGSITLCSGTTASSLKIHDGTSASGTLTWQLTTIATTAAGDDCVSVEFPDGLIVPTTGIFVDWTGTGAVGFVAWRPL